MFNKLIIAVLFAALAINATASDVVDATDANFKEVIGSAPLVLMKFYAPWCGHCKKLAPEWDAAATTIKEDKTLAGKVLLAKMDATVEQGSAREMEIQGYPTIKIFRDGELAGEYDGQRNKAGIIQWVKGNTGPAVEEINTKEALEAVISDNNVVVVNFFNGEIATDSSYIPYLTIAKKLRSEYKFVVVTDSSVAGESTGKIKVFKSFDEKEETYDGPHEDTTALASFIKTASMKLFDEIGPENYKSYMDRQLPLVWVFATPNDANSDAAKEQVEAAAASFKGKVLFVWIDAAKYAGMANRVGLKGNKFPAVALAHNEKNYVFDESAEITTEVISVWVQQYLDNKLTSTLRSEAEPEEHTVEGLTTVVGSTFDVLITNEKNKYILIEFYAPWCGHCKKLAPEYRALAKALKDVDNIRIAQFDATSNDFDRHVFNVKGFPTIMFIDKDKNGEPTPYEGERTADAMLTFLKKMVKSIPENIGVNDAKDEL